MTFEFTDREVQIIVESIRINEANSRVAFYRRVILSEGTAATDEKVARAAKHFRDLVELRAKLGDTKPITLDGAKAAQNKEGRR